MLESMRDRKQLIEAIISAMSTDDAIFHGIHIDMIRDRVYISGLPAVSEYSYDELKEVVNRLILADCRRGEKSFCKVRDAKTGRARRGVYRLSAPLIEKIDPEL